MFISRRPLCHENYANSNKRQEVDHVCSFAHHEPIIWTLKCLQWKSCQLQKRWGSWSCLLISRPLASSSFHKLPVNGLILFAVSASQKLICARALTSSSMFHTVSYTTCIVHMLHCIRGASILDYAVHWTNINKIHTPYNSAHTPHYIIHTNSTQYSTMKRSHPQVWYIKVQYILKLNT